MGDHCQDRGDEFASLANLLPRVRQMPGADIDHLAHRENVVPARQCVVTHVGDAICREVALARRQQPVAHRAGNPRIDAVRNDVVELAKFRIEIDQVHMPELQVVQIQRRCELAGAVDLPLGEIDTHKAAARQGVGHGYEVAAPGATYLQHAAVIHSGWAQTQQRTYRGHPARVRQAVAEFRVGNLVVDESLVFALVHGAPDDPVEIPPSL